MNATRPQSIVERLAEDVRSQIRSGTLTAGTRLPSVRRLARDRQVSLSTAAEIYNVLVATGNVEARKGMGYFVVDAAPPRTRVRALEYPADSLWERRTEALTQPILADAGCGWLPADWLPGRSISDAMRRIARGLGVGPEGYANPQGSAELRAHLMRQLRLRGLQADESQIVLTQGASQALNLLVQLMLQPGDLAIVEEPGYPPLLEMLRAQRVRLLAVARTDSGPDVDALARRLRRLKPRVMFTNTTLHNPTGTTTTPAIAHRILELAERHDFEVVEDDIFADLAPQPATSLAALDQFRRVAYVASFSKTISPDLRVGYVVARGDVAKKLARAKVLTSLASSEIVERLVLRILTEGHYRRRLDALRNRLQVAQQSVSALLQRHGVRLVHRPANGMFLWGSLPSAQPVSTLWRRALEHGVLLAPGELFMAEPHATNLWRFNVTHCDSPALASFLKSLDYCGGSADGLILQP